MKHIIYFFVALFLVISIASTQAQVPRIISYQGILLGSNEQPVPEGSYKLTFRFYDEANALIWTEVHNQVFIGGGMFTVFLGSQTPLSIPFDKPYFLGIQVGSDPELQPRMPVTSTAYAIRAEDADKLMGIFVSPMPEPNKLLPLDASGKFPASVISGGVSGNFIKKNAPDTSRATSTSPILLISNLGNGDGMNARSISGVGLAGRSDNNDGVTGWTGASSKSGVFGSSTEGRGVVGRSEKEDGIVGWSGGSKKSGVFGHTEVSDGYGIWGRNNTYGTNGYLGGIFGAFGQGSGSLGSHGGYFETSGGFAAGVYGKATANLSYGGFFETSGDYSYGIYAIGPPADKHGCAARFKGNVEIRSRATDNVVVELGEGLDYAEGFHVSDKTEIAPGSVLVIDSENPGKLALSSKPYDNKVAGIVAGAKGLGSGVKLGSDQYDFDVALAGRVYCNVDASYGAVEPGDLLTTSITPGYAMVVKNHKKAPGAILGKAMEKLPSGQKGQILVLVTLQ